MWYLYLLECANGAQYAGITNDLPARYLAHSSGKGAKFTRTFRPVRVLGSCAYPDRATALRAEHEIKQLPAKLKLAFLRDQAERSCRPQRSGRLHMALKEKWFKKIQAGTKPNEYRLITPHWVSRIQGRVYDDIELTWAYPPAGDAERRLIRPWRGFSIEHVVSEEWGGQERLVFAIDVRAVDEMDLAESG